MQPTKFSADARLPSAVEQHASLAIGFVQERFHLSLDWSDASMEHVENVLDAMYAGFQRSTPPPKRVQSIATSFGCYIGEAIRRNYGGTWGLVTSGAGESWGLMCRQVLVYPIDKVYKRLQAGKREDICHYYNGLKSLIEASK